MNAIELLDIINTGETSKVQFKEKITSPDNFSAEIVAMANSLGGIILLGIEDKSGEIIGLTDEELHDYGTRVANIATENIIPDYFKKEFHTTIEQKGLDFKQALKVKRVLRNDKLTLAGLLFFGKGPQTIKPGFCIKAVSFLGNSIAGKYYRNKPEDLKGTVPDLFENGMKFLESNLRHMQKGQNFNSIGILEISRDALVEILVNALVHRDYLKNAPIRIMIFDNRVEIISPGKLPNSLTVEEAMYGNPVIRNPQIVKFSSHTMPYSGIGTGLTRALKEQPDIELNNDVDGVQFIVKFPRPEIDI